MILAFDTIKVSSNSGESGFVYEFDGRVLCDVQLGDKLYLSNDANATYFVVKEIITYGNSVKEISAGMGCKLLLVSSEAIFLYKK